MNKFLKIYFIFIIIFIVNNNIVSQETIEYNGVTITNSTNKIKYSYADQTFDCSEDVLNLGTIKDTIIVSLNLKNNTNSDLVFVKINNSTLDFIECSYNELGSEVKTFNGLNIEKEKRAFSDQYFLFSIPIKQNETKEISFKIFTSKKLIFPIEISSLVYFKSKETTRSNLMSIYFGIFISIALFNLILFITIKNKQYGYFSIFVFFSGLIQLIVFGYGDKIILSNYPFLSARAIPIFASINGVFTMLFFNSLLNFKKASNFLYKLFYIELIGFTFIFFLSFTNNLYTYTYDLISIFSLPSLVIILSTIKGDFSKNIIGRSVLGAMAIFIFSLIAFVLKENSILPFNDYTSYILPIGKIIMFFMLAVAVSNNYQLLKYQKEEATFAAFDALEKNKTLIQNQKATLEIQVKERTLDLNESNKELKQAYAKLETTQRARIEAEKMSSLGQLTAGIAHEINNPINFITNNVSPLRRDLDEMKMLIRKYESSLEFNINQEIVQDIEDYKKEIDYKYLDKEIDILLAGISEGSKRTGEIVQSLKIYSHLDSGEMRRASIIEGLQSTIIIMASNFKTDCDIVAEIDSNIENILCLPGKLNQVFMNIINNAAHAVIDKHRSFEDRKVTVKCYQTPEHIIVKVTDNGNGIPAHVQERIFDPFFTTKEAGLGTGLGLSISKTIMENHHGDIKINTKKGEGTEFIVSLPIHPNIEKNQ